MKISKQYLYFSKKSSLNVAETMIFFAIEQLSNNNFMEFHGTDIAIFFK